MCRFLSIGWSIVLLLSSINAFALTADDCPSLLARAETGESMDINPYDFCDFGNEEVAWEVWAPYVSQQQYKRALFELCKRYPNHIYHSLYCEKSAELGYGPALALKAQNLLEKGDGETGLRWANQALDTQELTEEQIGQLYTTIGLYYFNKDDTQFQTYLKKASTRRSALANHILGVLAFSSPDISEETKKDAFMYIWRAILLGCPNAEENLGLFHLVRQQKIPYETACQIMKDKMTTCHIDSNTDTPTITDDRNLFNCQCKTVLTNEKRFKEKPYLLLKIENGIATLQDKSGQKYTVSAKDNLPHQGNVDEVRKTAVIITYPQNRIILNLYKEDKCTTFCNKYNIIENLSFEAMQKKILGTENAVLKPYHLSFNKDECDTLTYYANHLVDTSLPYTGKKECSQTIVYTHTVSDDSDKQGEPKTISNETKKRLQLFGTEILGI